MHAAALAIASTLALHTAHAPGAQGAGAAAGAPKSQASGKVRLAIVGMRNDGVDEKVVRQVVDALALRLSRHARTEVLTATEIQAVLGLEAARQALDCDSSGCAAMDEITKALDVRYVVTGSVAPKSAGFYVHVSLVDVKTSRALTRAAGDADADDFAGGVAPIGDEVLRALHGDDAVQRTTSAKMVTPSASTGLSPLAWVGVGIAGLGATAALTGAILWGADDALIRDTTSKFDDKEAARARYAFDQAVLGAGCGVVVIGGALFGAALVLE